MLGFYIGAGASAKSLPVAKSTPDRLKEIADTVEPIGKDYSCDKKDRVEVLVRDLRCLSDRSESAPSIDSLARRYYLRGEEQKLRWLKRTLAAFFLLEQSRKTVDPRYTDFFSYMAGLDEQTRLALPTNLRVISWNYDIQFEKAFADFLQHSETSETERALQVFPGIPKERYRRDLFSILKINGTASMEDGRQSGRLYTAYGQHIGADFKDALESALGFHEDGAPEQLDPYLRFAWEDDGRRNDVLDLIVPVGTLVVVGYSFPLFNRDVDRQVLERLGSNELYVQVGADGPAVKERLVGLGVDAGRVRVVEDVDQFYIPHSYSPTQRKSPPLDP